MKLKLDFRFCALTALCLLIGVPSGCGGSGSADDGGSGGNGSGTSGKGASTSSSSSASGSSAPEPAGSGDFQKSFSKNAVGVTCEMSFDEMKSSGAPSITVGDATIFVGYQQFDQNQDPVFFRFDKGQKTYCEHHEKESPDGRAYGITWDGGPKAYVVYTIVGGGSAFDEKAQGTWMNRYGDGGGSSKVAVIGEVETKLGTVTRATFVPAKIIKDGQTKTNTLNPAGGINVLEDGSIEFTGGSAWSPLNPDQSLMCKSPDVYPGALDGADGPNFLARFSADLKTMICSTTKACSNVLTPCP